MTNPTGKLKFAYDTIRNLEAEIAALKQALAQPDHSEDSLDMVGQLERSGSSIDSLVDEFESTPKGFAEMENGRQWVRENFGPTTDSIQKELRKPAHYLSMSKREQAANYIDKLQTAMNQYSSDEVRLTHQSTIADQALTIAMMLSEQEPVAWMVYTQDGQSVYVTDNPTDIQEGQRALPLYTGKTT
jgi:cell division septum initiation protein DivIVA